MRCATEISVVVPVYNSADCLRELVERILAVLYKLARSYDIVLVDDGSRDASWDVLKELQAQYGDCVTAVRLMRNYGQHNALMCGFRHCRGELIVTIDDDLQNPPEEIEQLHRSITNNGYDLVYGNERSKEHEGWRNIGSSLARVFYRTVFHSQISPTSFRIMRRQLMESILPYALNYTYVDGLLAWNTQWVGSVEVEHRERVAGRSGYSVPKLLLLALNLFTNFSLLPLQMVSICGFLAALGGFGLGLFYLGQFLLANIAVPGFASTIIAILVLGGAQMLALGIIGEYLGRLHLNVNRKPQYTERSVLGPSAQTRLLGQRDVGTASVIVDGACAAEIDPRG
jgi:undecaprenyl-phosphate 4-deoxy-4-formamido-L-arabinose transferase